MHEVRVFAYSHAIPLMRLPAGTDYSGGAVTHKNSESRQAFKARAGMILGAVVGTIKMMVSTT
jgi:hypothetical protein